MGFTDHTNFAYSTIPAGGAPSPATSGASLKVASSSDRNLFPTPPFQATVWPAGVTPTAANAEIVQVNGTTGTDGFVMARAQDGSTARTITAGYQIAATITSKVIDDVETLLTNSSFINTVGTDSISYTTDGIADDVQLNQALLDAHNAGGGVVWITSPLTVANIITLYPDVKLCAFGDRTPISISSDFAAGVVLREQSGAADYLTLEDITVDLAGKANVGGIHIYQGNFVYLKNPHIKNQGFTSASKWALRVGNYVNGSPDSTASHGTIIENLRITDCNCGTFEQLLFVNQQDARITNPYFEGNTNSLAYELMLYINNKNVVVDNPHFENPSAHSIGMMESDGIVINSTTVNSDSDFKIATIINTRNVTFNTIQGKNTLASPTTSVVEFFDRAVGPDGFTQIVEDTELVTFNDLKIDGWKSVVNCQLASADYTMNQSNIEFNGVIIRNQSVPFNIGANNSFNNLHDWDFDRVNILSWSGATTGIWQLRGYTSGVGQMYGFRFNRCKAIPSTSTNSAAIRTIGATVESVTDCDFRGNWGLGALSTNSGGVFEAITNVKGINSISQQLAPVTLVSQVGTSTSTSSTSTSSTSSSVSTSSTSSSISTSSTSSSRSTTSSSRSTTSSSTSRSTSSTSTSTTVIAFG